MEDGTNQSSTPVSMSGAAAPLSVSGAAALAAPPSCELSLTREKSDVKPGDGRTECLMSLHTETNLACAENCSGTYVFWPGHGTVNVFFAADNTKWNWTERWIPAPGCTPDTILSAAAANHGVDIFYPLNGKIVNLYRRASDNGWTWTVHADLEADVSCATPLACASAAAFTCVSWPGENIIHCVSKNAAERWAWTTKDKPHKAEGVTPSTRLVAAGAGAGTQAIMCFACEGTIHYFTFLGDRDDEPSKWVCGTWKSQIVLGRPQVRPEICLTCSTDGTHSVVYWAADGAMNQMQLIQEIEGGWRWVKRELRYWDVKPNSRLVSTGEGNSIFWSGEGKLFHLQKSPENDWKWSQKPEEYHFRGNPSLAGKRVILRHATYNRMVRSNNLPDSKVKRISHSSIDAPLTTSVSPDDISQVIFEVKNVGDSCLAFLHPSTSRFMHVTSMGGVAAKKQDLGGRGLERFRIKALPTGAFAFHNTQTDRWLSVSAAVGKVSSSAKGAWNPSWQKCSFVLDVLGLADSDSQAFLPNAEVDVFPSAPPPLPISAAAVAMGGVGNGVRSVVMVREPTSPWTGMNAARRQVAYSR